MKRLIFILCCYFIFKNNVQMKNVKSKHKFHARSHIVNGTDVSEGILSSSMVHLEIETVTSNLAYIFLIL